MNFETRKAITVSTIMIFLIFEEIFGWPKNHGYAIVEDFYCIPFKSSVDSFFYRTSSFSFIASCEELILSTHQVILSGAQIIYQIGSKVLIGCEKKYIFIDGSESKESICMENRTWTPILFKCESKLIFPRYLFLTPRLTSNSLNLRS